ncbi:hypothetical protein EDB83DRAFT_1837670 [Lactarius deliciosus]|nr:hypothetical protein EDB83DRAFT_1837670 [Lactarius deliciosus]
MPVTSRLSCLATRGGCATISESLSLAQTAPAYSSRGVTQRETKAPTSARTSKSTHGNAGAIVVTSINCITTGGVRPRRKTCIHQEGGNPVASLRTLTARCSDGKQLALAQGSALFLSRGVGCLDLASIPIERHSFRLVSVSVQSAILSFYLLVWTIASPVPFPPGATLNPKRL